MRVATQLFSSKTKKYPYTATIEAPTLFQAVLKHVRLIKAESPNAPIKAVGYTVILNR